ncbi:hypothetical protein Q3G72_008740 [Acer saccharum]|nr:hypothetical protein Q3G72_008740 [Acer saccharum]
MNGALFSSSLIFLYSVIHTYLSHYVVRLLQTQMSSMSPFGITSNEANMSTPSFKWRRVLLNVNGEALACDHAQNIDPNVEP